MKKFFKRLFGRKQHITIDCETAGILRDTKKDFDTLTRILHAMPVKATNLDEVNPAVQNQRQELWEWNAIARMIHYNIGVDIENLERIMNQRIPSLKDAESVMHPVTEEQDDYLTRRIKELIS